MNNGDAHKTRELSACFLLLPSTFHPTPKLDAATHLRMSLILRLTLLLTDKVEAQVVKFHQVLSIPLS